MHFLLSYIGVFPTGDLHTSYRFVLFLSIKTTELDKENPDLLPYLISRGEKIGCIHFLLVIHSEAADHMCTSLQAQPTQLDAT